MGLFKTKAPEEKAADEARKLEERQHRDYQRWLNSPAGQARQAHARGDFVFQASFDLGGQTGYVVPMVGVGAYHETSDPNVLLNAICAEGWEPVGSSVVFVFTGQESRDKFMASGQQVTMSGRTVGYYLFRRR